MVIPCGAPAGAAVARKGDPDERMGDGAETTPVEKASDPAEGESDRKRRGRNVHRDSHVLSALPYVPYAGCRSGYQLRC